MMRKTRDAIQSPSSKPPRSPLSFDKEEKTAATAEAIKDQFLDWLRLERRASPNTVAAYSNDLANLFRFFESRSRATLNLKHIAELKTETLRSWMIEDMANGASNATRARRLGAVRTFYRFLARHHGVNNRAPKSMSLPRFPQRLPRALRQDQALSVVRQSSIGDDNSERTARYEAVFSLLYGGGLRLGEALALNVREAPLPGSSAALRIAGKGGRERLVPVLPAVREAIDRYLKYRPDAQLDDPLFQGKQGKRLRPSVVQLEFRKIRERLGLPGNATPHALRHSCASHLLANGVDLRAIQEMMGHVNLVSTQTYTLVDEAMLERTASLHPRR